MKGRKHCLKPSWDNAASIANTDAYRIATDAIEWTRLRIESLSKDAALRVIKKCKYRERLKERILKWILDGHYPSVLGKLSLVGLKRATQTYGMDFLLRYGREKFYREVGKKVRHALWVHAEVDQASKAEIALGA